MGKAMADDLALCDNPKTRGPRFIVRLALSFQTACLERFSSKLPPDSFLNHWGTQAPPLRGVVEWRCGFSPTFEGKKKKKEERSRIQTT